MRPIFAQNSLIGAIYDLAMGQSDWDGLLDIIATAFPGCAVLVSGDNLAENRNLSFAQRGLPSGANAGYLTNYAAQNPWREGQARTAVGQPYHDEQLRERAAAISAPFYKDWLGTFGDFAAGTGIVLLREGTRQLTLDVRYAAQTDQETRNEVFRVLSELAPHFARAFQLLKSVRLADSRSWFGSVVEDLPYPVFLLSPDMSIRYNNPLADALRHDIDGPFAGSDSQLRAFEAEEDVKLRDAVTRTGKARRNTSTIVQLTKAADGSRTFVVARKTGATGNTFGLHEPVFGFGPLVMLIVHAEQDAIALHSEAFWRAFSFTESEAQLAEALLSGCTLGEFAKARAVSKQTLRNQLVGVMRKTGTSRQSQLVSLLTRLSLSCA